VHLKRWPYLAEVVGQRELLGQVVEVVSWIGWLRRAVGAEAVEEVGLRGWAVNPLVSLFDDSAGQN
jgi:hypothetical protein